MNHLQHMLPEYQSLIQERLLIIPIFETLKLEILKIELGIAEMEIPRDVKYNGVFKTLHGGILMTLADTAACVAIFSQVSKETEMATVDMNIRFLRPCITSAKATAKIIKLGKTLCLVSVEITDESDVLIAIAQVNYMLLNKKTFNNERTKKTNK